MYLLKVLRSLLVSLPLFLFSAQATVVNATWNAATDVAVTATSYSATGNTVNFILNHAPVIGENLTVVKNTGLAFIQGTFGNLSQGQDVNLTYAGTTYRFVANYYGGSGNDLVLQWAGLGITAWGKNDCGQLGNNSTTNSSVPVAENSTGVLSGKTVVAVAGGEKHSLAVCSDGTVATWGRNFEGQLGNNSTTDSSVPVAVDTTGALSGKTVVAVSAGWSHSLALCSDGTMAAWGYNYTRQLGNNGMSFSRVPVAVDTAGVLSGKTVVTVTTGLEHNLALCSDGTVAAWGANMQGQLGHGGGNTSGSMPVAVDRTGVLSGKTVVAVAAGEGHSLVLCSDGTMATWGSDGSGQLGDNNNPIPTDSSVPVAVVRTGVLSGKTVVAIAAGGRHNLALCSDGTMVAWGWNGSGELGNNSTAMSGVPVAVDRTGVLSGKTVTSVSAGSDYSLALCSDGTVATWGYNASGQLGNNSTTSSKVPVAVNATGVLSARTVVAVSAGDGHSLALAAVTAYESWMATVFTSQADRDNPAVSGPNANPAGDGITNLMKYALALDPLVCGTGDLPKPAIQAGYLTLTYRKNQQATDVTYTVEACDSLNGNWSVTSAVVSQVDMGGYWEVTVRDTVPIADSPPALHAAEGKQLMRRSRFWQLIPRSGRGGG